MLTLRIKLYVPLVFLQIIMRKELVAICQKLVLMLTGLTLQPQSDKESRETKRNGYTRFWLQKINNSFQLSERSSSIARINLLLNYEETKSHYDFIKNLDRLLYDQTKHRERKHFCEKCLRSRKTSSNAIAQSVIELATERFGSRCRLRVKM